jgi:hypothetical protein
VSYVQRTKVQRKVCLKQRIQQRRTRGEDDRKEFWTDSIFSGNLSFTMNFTKGSF